MGGGVHSWWMGHRECRSTRNGRVEHHSVLHTDIGTVQRVHSDDVTRPLELNGLWQYGRNGPGIVLASFAFSCSGPDVRMIQISSPDSITILECVEGTMSTLGAPTGPCNLLTGGTQAVRNPHLLGSPCTAAERTRRGTYRHRVGCSDIVFSSLLLGTFKR